MTLRRRYDDLRARYDAHVAADEADQEAAAAEQFVMARPAGELDVIKSVVASHIAAAGHSSTVLHDARAFADALRQALADAGVDIRLELARLEGGEL